MQSHSSASGEALDRPARETARQPRSVVCWTEKKNLCTLGLRMTSVPRCASPNIAVSSKSRY